MSQQWALRTRPRSGRIAFLRTFRSDGPGWNVEWGTNAEAQQFATRTLAVEYRDSLTPMCGRYLSRLVPHRLDKPTPTAQPRNPRGTVAPTVSESERIDAAIASAYARAHAVALSMPARADVHVFVTDGMRHCRGGRDRRGRYFISVDRWTLRDERPGYLLYLVAHELSHVVDVFARGRTDHGPLFMAHLRMLCPPSVIAYELTYKNRMAAACGIRASESAPEVAAHVRETLARRRGIVRRPTLAEQFSLLVALRPTTT